MEDEDRRAARAKKSAKQLLVKLMEIMNDLKGDPATLRGEGVGLASGLDRDWAALVLLALWDSRRMEKDALRPHVKEALVLLDTKGRGTSRSLDDLARLIAACWIDSMDAANMVVDFWKLDDRKNQESLPRIHILGGDLPTTEDMHALVDRGILASMTGIARVLTGESEPGKEFPKDSFPHMSMIPANGKGTSIWKGLYMRLVLMIALVQRGDTEWEIATVPQGVLGMIAMNGKIMRYDADDVRESMCYSSGNIAANPCIEAYGAMWTSPALILDSLAPWLLQTVQATELRQRVISQPFEDRVVDTLRAHGYEAGPVDDAGVWITRNEHMKLGSKDSIPGQIDALARRGNDVLLIECKSLYSMSRPRNTLERIAPYSNEWRNKLEAKAQWLRAIGLEPALKMIVVEGLDYAWPNEANKSIPMATFGQFEGILDEADRY